MFYLLNMIIVKDPRNILKAINENKVFNYKETVESLNVEIDNDVSLFEISLNVIISFLVSVTFFLL